MIKIAVPKDRSPNEQRVALVPDAVSRLKKLGAELWLEEDAGGSAGYPDARYADAGAVIHTDIHQIQKDAQLIVRVQKPSPEEIERLPEACTLIALLNAAGDSALTAALSKHRVTALALERVPRISRAQSMDVLSSQATVAGYKAVLIGASLLPRMMPMLTTAAGTITPAKTFVIGAGVAGLQAIATARRLGAVVSAFDIRPAAREQVHSLGASFVAAEAVSAGAEDKGGYARAQSAEEQAKTATALEKHLADMDLVITTAAVPGKRAPQLISESMIAGMKPGSVIVDLAAEAGGNCALTKAGETITAHGVSILGPVNLPATVPFHASQMFSKNIVSYLEHLLKNGSLNLDLNDEITGPMCVTHAGEVLLRS